MATYTSNYGWTKPSGSDNVDISVLNDNLDDQDSTIHDAFLNMAPPFSESSTYAVDDIVLYGTGLYKCHTAVVTPGSWTGSTNWQVYKLSEGGSGGGGGTSDYNPLTNKPQINGVTLIGNKTTNDLGITASGVGAIPSTDKGANGGVAELDSNGLVPASQLPSYVDDVLEGTAQNVTETGAGTYSATGFILSGESSPCVPESGKTYVDTTSNIQYRWTGTGTNFVSMGSNLALGETSSTAYRGDRGKIAYDHSQTTGNPHGTTAADVGLDNVPNVSTNDQTPTFTEASARNNIASGEKLSVILGKIQKFFNDLKTVAFSGSFTDLTNKPENANTFQGTIAEWNQLTTAEKKAYDHASIPDSLDGNVTFPASKVMTMNGDSVEDRLDAHTFGTAVDITSYTSSSKYTCPSDGYIFLDATAISVTNGTISVAIDTGSNPTSWAAARKSYIETNIIYAKKGMQIYIAYVDTGGKAYFYPLS